MLSEKQEGTMSIIAALLVLFTAMIAPPISALLAVLLLIAFAIYKYTKSDRKQS